MRLDTESLLAGIKLLKEEASSISHPFKRGFKNELAVFSNVTGYREAGQALGLITSMSAPESFKVLASHLMDAANVSEINLKNMKRSDDSLSGMFKGIDLATLNPLVAEYGQMEASLNVVNAKATAFHPQAPVAAPPMTLRMLEQLLMATNIAAAEAEAANWTLMARAIDESVAALFGVKNSFATSLETRWVQRGDERINKIQHAGNAYARRADAMSMHTSALAKSAAAETAMAAAAAAVAVGLPPTIRPAYEATYLAAFGPRASSQLVATIPTFAKLLPDLDQVPGNPFDIREAKQPTAPSFDRSPLPKIIRDSFMALGHGDLARATTPDDVINAYGKVNPDVVEAIKAGATQTQAASLSAPSMPPTLNPGAGMPAGAPGSLGSAAGMNSISPGAIGSNAAGVSSGTGASTGGGLAGGGMGAFGGANGNRGGRNGLGSPSSRSNAGRGAAHAQGLAGGIGMGSMAGGLAAGIGASGMGMGTGMGAGMGMGMGSGGAPLNGAGAPGTGAAPGANAYGASSANSGAQARSTTVAGGPMAMGAGGGAGGQGKQRKAAKVQAVTSAVERDGNLKALLGEAPLVLPSVIGHNVRD